MKVRLKDSVKTQLQNKPFTIKDVVVPFGETVEVDIDLSKKEDVAFYKKQLDHFFDYEGSGAYVEAEDEADVDQAEADIAEALVEAEADYDPEEDEEATEEMTLNELQEMATRLGYKGFSRMSKSDLIVAINDETLEKAE